MLWKIVLKSLRISCAVFIAITSIWLDIGNYRVKFCFERFPNLAMLHLLFIAVREQDGTRQRVTYAAGSSDNSRLSKPFVPWKCWSGCEAVGDLMLIVVRSMQLEKQITLGYWTLSLCLFDNAVDPWRSLLTVQVQAWVWLVLFHRLNRFIIPSAAFLRCKYRHPHELSKIFLYVFKFKFTKSVTYPTLFACLARSASSIIWKHTSVNTFLTLCYYYYLYILFIFVQSTCKRLLKSLC